MTTQSPHPAPRSRKKVVKAYLMLDITKPTERLCYADQKGSYLYKKGAIAIFFNKTGRPRGPWMSDKQIVPCTITYTLPTIKSSKRRRKV